MDFATRTGRRGATLLRWARLLFVFHGRIGRAGCWLYTAIALPLSLLLVLAFWAYALSVPGAYENGGTTPPPGGWLGAIGAIVYFSLLTALLVSGLAVMVKRLHDRDKASWWIAVFVLLPDTLFGLAQYLADSATLTNGSAIFAVQFAAAAFSAWGLIELGILRGTVGANRFGPDPLATT